MRVKLIPEMFVSTRDGNPKVGLTEDGWVSNAAWTVRRSSII